MNDNEIEYIIFNDIITPNQYIGIKPRETLLKQRVFTIIIINIVSIRIRIYVCILNQSKVFRTKLTYSYNYNDS